MVQRLKASTATARSPEWSPAATQKPFIVAQCLSISAFTNSCYCRGFTLKVLHILDKPPGDGGLAIHVAGLCEQLTARGHASPVLRLTQQSSANNKTEHWQDEYQLASSYGLLQGVRLKSELVRLLKKIQPDIVHVHGCFTTLSPVLLRELRLKYIVLGTLHDIRPFCYVMSRRFAPSGQLCERRCGFGCFSSGCVKPKNPIDALRLSRRWLMDAKTLAEWKCFKRVIAPSAYISDLALQHGLSKQALRLVPHGVALPTTTTRAQNPEDTAVIMYLGSLFEYKGVLQLIEALRLLQQTEWRAIIVGNGPLRAQLVQRLDSSGLSNRVEILDSIQQRDELNQLLASARMLVLPSIIPEAFALVGIEALAAGTPVVSFALGGIQQWLRDGENGLAAADLDCADLARQIDTLLAAPARAVEMGARGRALVESCFSQERAFEHTLSVYQELVD